MGEFIEYLPFRAIKLLYIKYLYIYVSKMRLLSEYFLRCVIFQAFGMELWNVLFLYYTVIINTSRRKEMLLN